MSEEKELDNVIQVDFSAPRSVQTHSLSPPYYDVSTFGEDPLASKKYEVFSSFIEEGMVSVTLEPDVPGVSIPEHLAQHCQLVLNFSHRFFIDDFSYDEHAICASLSFSGQTFYCIVPWLAVKVLLSHHDNTVAVFDTDML